MKKASIKKPKGEKLTLPADANYFSEGNLKACKEREVEAIIPDGQYKKRLKDNKSKQYGPDDFVYNKRGDYYKCPNGKKLIYRGSFPLHDTDMKEYRASVKNCLECPFIKNCINTKKDPSKMEHGRRLSVSPNSLCNLLRKKLNTVEYQDRYACRIQIIEPVFANIKSGKGLDRFMLRGRAKVNSQWQLYCITHNLGKCLNEYNKREKIA